MHKALQVLKEEVMEEGEGEPIRLVLLVMKQDLEAMGITILALLVEVGLVDNQAVSRVVEMGA
jgi:hypothetical protein